VPVVESLGTMSSRAVGHFHTEYRVPEGYVRNNTEVSFWKVPYGITRVHICLIGGGGSGGSKYGGGGNGGNLVWINDVVVTPGTYIEVGAGLGGRCVSPLTNEVQYYGGDSYYGIWNQYAPTNTVKLAIARGGLAGTNNTGNGTAGGGAGAAGYATIGGAGGAGGSVSASFIMPDPTLTRQASQPVNLIPTSGIGTSATALGGQGGQGSTTKTSTTVAGAGNSGSAGGGSGAWVLAKGGGGVGIYGQGIGGLAGRAVGYGGTGLFIANGGSNGQNGKIEGTGGNHGGGGAGSRTGGAGGLGAVRILWGSGRSWPSTLVADQPITDTTGQVLIVPQVIPATALVETYNLTGPTTANEGTTVTFILTATNVYRASLQWTTTGATSSADFATGTLTSGNIEIDTTTTPYTTTISFPISNDNLTEGAEELTVKVRIFKDNFDGTYNYEDACSATVSILDTSKNHPTYAFAAPYNSADAVMNEGTTYPVTVNTTWVPHGTILYWSIRNSTSVFGDFTGDLFGSCVVTQTSFITISDGSTVTKDGSGTIQITPKADLLTEGTEYFYIDLRLNSQSDPAVILSSARIAIGDTSVEKTIIAPARLDVYEYAGSWTFSIGTTGYPVGTTLYWQVVHGSTNDADFVGPLNGPLNLFDVQGSIRGVGRLGIIIEDNKTEGTETFSIVIKESQASTVILATIPCTITDTSLDPVFTFLDPPTSINEGTTYTFNISCTAPITTNLFYSVTGLTANSTTDFLGSVELNGFSMTSGAGGFELTPKADTITEGPETFIIKIYRSTADYLANKPVATSPTITINDTSAAASITVPQTLTLTEGTSSSISAVVVGYPLGTTFYWKLIHGTTNAADFLQTNLSGTTYGVSQTTSGIYEARIATLSAKADTTTEGPETFSIIIKSSEASTVVLATIAGIITDTSTDPVYVFVAPYNTNNATMNEGTPYNVVVNAMSGSAIATTFNTTIYYSVSGTVNANVDFTGSVNINPLNIVNGVGLISLTPIADSLTEGDETFVIKIWKDLASWQARTNPLAASGTITVNDTSQAALDCTPFAGSITVTGRLTGGTVWGSNPYTTDSDWNVAAVHAGLVSVGETAEIQKILPAGDTYFPGSTSNGITTTSWNSYWCGVVITRANGTLSGVCTATAAKTIFYPAAQTAFSFVTSATGCVQTNIAYTEIGPANLTPYLSKDFQGNFTGGVDDGFWQVDLPFPISFLGTTYNTVYVGTNSYVTFGGGSTQYAGLNYAAPAFPKILITAADNSCQRLYYGAESTNAGNTFRIRWEGCAALHYYGPLGTDFPGEPNMVWEMVFYSSPNNKIELNVISNAKAP
jgi:LCCL domain